MSAVAIPHREIIEPWVEHGLTLPVWQRCPTCSSRREEPLVIGCMVMVMRVFELIGKRVVQRPRSRWKELGGRPLEVAHTIWDADEDQVDQALEGAWVQVPILLSLYGPDKKASRTPEVVSALSRVVREAVKEHRCVTVVDVRTALVPILSATEE